MAYIGALRVMLVAAIVQGMLMPTLKSGKAIRARLKKKKKGAKKRREVETSGELVPTALAHLTNLEMDLAELEGTDCHD